MDYKSQMISTEFEPIPAWTHRSGMTRTGTYLELGRGNLRAIKVGRRTLIDVQHGLAWLRSQPIANIRAPASQISNA